MELVLGAGSLSGDRFGTMRNLLGITDEFYDYMFGDLQSKETLVWFQCSCDPKVAAEYRCAVAIPSTGPVWNPISCSTRMM